MHGDAGGWLWLAIDLVLVGALALAMMYGTMMWRTRCKNRGLEQASEQATKQLYERGAENERRQEAENERKTAA
jgi:hypothetical protein